MDTLTIRQKLHDIIDKADDEKVEELFVKLIDDTRQPYEWWKDEELVAEMDRRSAALESGEDKGFTLEESMAHLKANVKRNA